MKTIKINCEFSDFLMALVKTYKYSEAPDSEDCFQLAKDNLYTYRHEPNGDEYEDEITDEELILLYHENVEIQILEISKHYGRTCYDLSLTFQNNMQFIMCYQGDILQLLKILISSCIAD